MADVTLVEAARLAALQEMRRDPTVWVLGEDVARGGLFGQYRGFLDEFGEARVVSTPISESVIMGAGLGAALVGTRPIIEMRIFDFVMCAMDELVNQIAKVRYMFGGQAKPAVVVRMPHGIWRNSAAQHSQTLESWFTHIPGLVVVVPSTPADTAGLLVSAIRSDDPVLFFDPKNLFPLTGEVPEVIEPIPFGVARQEQGTDSVIALGGEGEAEPLRRAAQEAVGNLHQHTAAVARLRVRADGAAMVEVQKNFETLGDNVMRFEIVHVRHETDAARILLVGGIVKAMSGGERVIVAGMGLRHRMNSRKRRKGGGKRRAFRCTSFSGHHVARHVVLRNKAHRSLQIAFNDRTKVET